MTRGAKAWMAIAILLFVVIIAMVTMLFTIPGPHHDLVATSTPEKPLQAAAKPTPVTPPANQPLSTKVIVSSPQPHTSVGATFVVTGKAPGNWFSEATFPIQVKDKDGNVIARTHASAQGEWMTTNLVTFTSTVNIDGTYKGPATLALLRDNPSGLPENDDAVEVSIVIQ